MAVLESTKTRAMLEPASIHQRVAGPHEQPQPPPGLPPPAPGRGPGLGRRGSIGGLRKSARLSNAGACCVGSLCEMASKARFTLRLVLADVSK